MRRTIASVLCLLMVATMGGSAAAQGHVGAEVVTGAGAYWWRHGKTHGTLYLLDVYESTGTYGNNGPTYRAYFGAIQCDVGGRRNRPTDCKWRRADYERVKVDSFEIDPLLNSANAVVHDGDRRGEITWTGRGDYSEPFFWQSAGDFIAPPYFMDVHASLIAFIGRDAKATGDLFGLDLQRGEFMDGGMSDLVFGGASVCLNSPWCWIAEGF